MRRPSDLLSAAIVLAAVLVGTLTAAGGAGFHLGVGARSAFAESYLLGVDGPVQPSPEAFRALGRLGRVVTGRYEIRPGDTLADIARLFGSGVDYIRSTNQLNSTLIHPGQTLVVHNGLGMLVQVGETDGRPETLDEIARRHNIPPADLARANRLSGVARLSDRWLEPGSVLFLPTVRLRFTDYLLPVAWARGRRLISSGYGMRRHPVYQTRRFHRGLDMPRPEGFPVKASRDGTVIFAGWRGAYGRLVILKHPGGLRTWYGHLSKIHVRGGDMVRAGRVIGRVGSSGLATGPHLHFEVRDRYGNSLNPKKYLF